MAKCIICGKPEEEVNLFDGVGATRIRKVCYSCSEREGITIIKKTTK